MSRQVNRTRRSKTEIRGNLAEKQIELRDPCPEGGPAGEGVRRGRLRVRQMRYAHDPGGAFEAP